MRIIVIYSSHPHYCCTCFVIKGSCKTFLTKPILLSQDFLTRYPIRSALVVLCGKTEKFCSFSMRTLFKRIWGDSRTRKKERNERLKTQQVDKIVLHYQRCKQRSHQRHHSNHRVQRGTSSVLEWITNRVANNCCLVCLGTFAAVCA